MPPAAEGFLQRVGDQILSPIITLIGLAAFVYFVWGVVKFIMNADNEEKRKEGQRSMIWGIVGMVILFGANAIIGIITRTVGS